MLRAVAHRFEHEADVLSAIALGGAEPCIRALVRVGQVVQQEPERASLLACCSASAHCCSYFASAAASDLRPSARRSRSREGITCW